nr:reverse transcriptase domain-containing protein [Tanacetum cinerariifolium]
MYVDEGSSMEILYEHCFNRLWPEVKNQMAPVTTLLTGFSGETICPLGQLRLLVTIGDADHSTRELMNFIIVRSLSPYNGIIGRPVIKEIKAVPSTVNGMLKFPIDGGIVTICSTILIPVECAMMITSYAVPKEVGVHPKYFKVALHPNFPDQEVAIGGTLSAKGRTELCLLLKENLDIFAWQPSYMTGVPRLVAEHRLNIRKGHSLVRWRMCLDFTDLNKACPQDCYSLPKIDWKVESLCGYPFKCFLDVYKGYHQIQLAESHEEKTTFHTGQRVYCYTKMPFGLKNTGATYQRLVNKAFDSQIGPGTKLYSDGKAILSLVFAAKWLRRTSVKEQVLADFLVEVPDESPPAASVVKTQQESWTLFTNGSSCVDGSGAGFILQLLTMKPRGKKAPHQGLTVRIIRGVSLQAVILYAVVKVRQTTPSRNESRGDNHLLSERENQSLGEGIKARLGERNKNWVEELSHVLWAHRTMIKSSHGDTPFSLTYGTEAVIPAKIGTPSYRAVAVDVVYNDEELQLNLDLLGERREQVVIRKAKSKLKMTKYYNARVRGVAFKPGDFVYSSNDASHAVDKGKIGPKWEGPYEVKEALGDGAYKLRYMDKIVFLRTWNNANLKKCYL